METMSMPVPEMRVPGIVATAVSGAVSTSVHRDLVAAVAVDVADAVRAGDRTRELVHARAEIGHEIDVAERREVCVSVDEVGGRSLRDEHEVVATVTVHVARAAHVDAAVVPAEVGGIHDLHRVQAREIPARHPVARAHQHVGALVVRGAAAHHRHVHADGEVEPAVAVDVALGLRGGGAERGSGHAGERGIIGDGGGERRRGGEEHGRGGERDGGSEGRRARRKG
jgi:hypothetical protein